MILNPLDYDYQWAPIVALIAASVALYGSWRANKIAEKNLSLSVDLELIKFREKWLSELRSQMSHLNASILIDGQSEKHDQEDFLVHASNVIFMLNPDDEDVPALRAILKKSNLDYNQTDEQIEISGKANVGENARKLTEICNRILKREWEKIKADMRKYNAKN